MHIVSLITMLLIVSFFLPIAYASKIYQWKDQNGAIVFGDKPSSDIVIKEVEILPLMTMPAYEIPEQKQEDKKETGKKEDGSVKSESESDSDDGQAFQYTEFYVSSPKEGDQIRSDSGNILISFTLNPQLNKHDTLTIYVDGKKQVKNSNSLSVNLYNLNRGEHSLFAIVKDKEGAILFNSNTIKFTIVRNSRLF